MIQPDKDGNLTVKTEQQFDSVVVSQRIDFCYLLLEQDGMIKRSIDIHTIQKIRDQKRRKTLRDIDGDHVLN